MTTDLLENKITDAATPRPWRAEPLDGLRGTEGYPGCDLAIIGADDIVVGIIYEAGPKGVGGTYKANAEAIVNPYSPKRDEAYTAMYATLKALADKGCRIIHGNYPEGTTCLDMQEFARVNQTPHKFADKYRAEILNGDHRCDRCAARAAIAKADEVAAEAKSD